MELQLINSTQVLGPHRVTFSGYATESIFIKCGENMRENIITSSSVHAIDEGGVVIFPQNDEPALRASFESQFHELD